MNPPSNLIIYLTVILGRFIGSIYNHRRMNTSLVPVAERIQAAFHTRAPEKEAA